MGPGWVHFFNLLFNTTGSVNVLEHKNPSIIYLLIYAVLPLIYLLDTSQFLYYFLLISLFIFYLIEML